MKGKIKCPRRKLYDLLEALEPANFAEIVLCNDLRSRHTYMKIRGYAKHAPIRTRGNLLLDFSLGLGIHVQSCRTGERCIDRYLSWLEEKAKKVMEERKLSPGKLHEIIRKLDFRYLDLLEF